MAYFRLLFLHDPEDHDFAMITQAGGAVDTLVALKNEGRVQHIGIAAGNVHVVSRYLDLASSRFYSRTVVGPLSIEARTS